jgi:hypothetical protein
MSVLTRSDAASNVRVALDRGAGGRLRRLPLDRAALIAA